MNGQNGADHADFRKNATKKAQGRPIVFMISVVFVFALIVLMTLCIIIFRPKTDDTPSFLKGTTGGTVYEPSVETGAGEYRRKDGYYTFLVCGTDKVSRNTDVMMLVSLDTKNGQINVLQIPRDTFINHTRLGYGSFWQINSIYTYFYNNSPYTGKEKEKDAMGRLAEEIESSLCVNIDRYILMDTEAFVSIIDIIGGVEYDVPFDMYYSDPEQNLLIDLKAGLQTLDGKAAEGFIRYRSGYATGDIGRVEARADFLKAVYTQLREKLTLSVGVEVAKSVLGYVVTDMSIDDAAYFATAVLGMDSGNINVKTLAGSALKNPETGVWRYYALNKRAALADINAYMNVFTKDIPLELFDKREIFTDDRNGNNPYISAYYYS